MTVVGKVSVNLPRLSPVVGLLDVHRGRPERLERDDQVGDVELRLEVQLNGDVLLTVLRLPPGLVVGAATTALGVRHAVHNVLDAVGGSAIKSNT